MTDKNLSGLMTTILIDKHVHCSLILCNNICNRLSLIIDNFIIYSFLFVALRKSLHYKVTYMYIVEFLLVMIIV